ncbi:unnamed protein product [Euphydryas editha]|uniref:Transposase n=1 Tax=Euphydryas editha TaxID=104508 RepID=A0AAU9TBE5_EUPED|nr:unnamed protein product [Euphydryas editha]
MHKSRDLTIAELEQIYKRRMSGNTLQAIAIDQEISWQDVNRIVKKIKTTGYAHNQPRRNRKEKKNKTSDGSISSKRSTT